MTPRDIVNKWVVLFNDGDAETLIELYHDEARNYQVGNDLLIEGKVELLKMFQLQFSVFDMVCIVESIFEDGEWAILEWSDPKGLRGCGFYHVVDDKILFQRSYWDRGHFLEQQTGDGIEGKIL
ncbi:MAG: nuclear transport factor 2 family protein [Bacillota bacterium]